MVRSTRLVSAGWDRDFVDGTNDKNDKYDKGAPDYQTGDKKDLKWRIICAGVERLVQEKGLRAEDVLLWCDWQVGAPARHMRPPLPVPDVYPHLPAPCAQSIYQDDVEEKLKGVASLIK